jgi:hypothetical protein
MHSRLLPDGVDCGDVRQESIEVRATSVSNEEASAPAGAGAELRKALSSFAVSMVGILGALLATTMLVTLIFEPSQSFMVLGPQNRNLAAIVDADGLIVEQGEGFTVGRGTSPGFVGRLYGNGALMVLPSFGGGCLTSPMGLSRVGQRLERPAR